MKSRISLFNRGVSRSLLRRFWPLWTGYAVYMLLRLPVRNFSGRLPLWDLHRFRFRFLRRLRVLRLHSVCAQPAFDACSVPASSQRA